MLDLHNLPTRYTEVQIMNRIRTLLDECGTDVIILDEFQHFYDRSTEKVWCRATEWIKGLMDLKMQGGKMKRLFIVVGLDYSWDVIRSNQQLLRRLKGILKLPCVVRI